MIPLRCAETIYTCMFITTVLLTKDIISIRKWINYWQSDFFEVAFNEE